MSSDTATKPRGRIACFIGPDRNVTFDVASSVAKQGAMRVDFCGDVYPSDVAKAVSNQRDLALFLGCPVVITTTNPLVVNELDPDEVTLVTVEPDGTVRQTLMRDTINFEARSQAYALGELWLSYCQGGTEPALVPPLEPTEKP